jgi:membrane protein DedA with SNARE-associated domain
VVAGLPVGRQGWEVRPELFGIEDALLDAADAIYDAIGWPGVIFLMAVESAAIPFPSEIIMPLAGWLLVKDAGHGFEWLFLAAFFGALGNTIGSLVAYYAGAWGGRPFLRRYGRFVFITRRELDWADRWFERYGEPAVFISRLLPVVRTFISVPAGVTRMNVWRFTFLTFAGSYPWSFGLAAAGFALGEHWERLTGWFRPVAVPIAIALALLVVVYIYRRVREVWREEHHILPSEDEP